MYTVTIAFVVNDMIWLIYTLLFDLVIFLLCCYHKTTGEYCGWGLQCRGVANIVTYNAGLWLVVFKWPRY